MNLGIPAIAATTKRVILLTIASALLLAAGDASNTSNSVIGSTPTMASDDNILAPLSPADAAAASAALAATLPPEIRSEIVKPATEDVPEAAPAARNLSELVGTLGGSEMDADMRCLATAVYFESRGEPLEGQLAVAQAILNRVESGRYARSVCGVVNQPGQFSFDRSRSPASGRDWRIAQSIARIASDDMWHPVAPKANSFHAARLSPGWRNKVRVARIGNHVFYR